MSIYWWEAWKPHPPHSSGAKKRYYIYHQRLMRVVGLLCPSPYYGLYHPLPHMLITWYKIQDRTLLNPKVGLLYSVYESIDTPGQLMKAQYQQLVSYNSRQRVNNVYTYHARPHSPALRPSSRVSAAPFLCPFSRDLDLPPLFPCVRAMPNYGFPVCIIIK